MKSEMQHLQDIVSFNFNSEAIQYVIGVVVNDRNANFARVIAFIA